MFVSDRLIFLQLEKTGCSHIARLLMEIVGGQQEEKHSRIDESLVGTGRRIIGSVRNPWDWYVSMWSYGCIKAGSLYENLTAPPKLSGHGWRKNPLHATMNLARDFERGTRPWRETYADARDPALFRRWLRMLHDPAYRYDLMDLYGESPISRYAGFFTYRYARMFARRLDLLYCPAMRQAGNLAELLRENILLDDVILNERLEADLIRVLAASGITLGDEQTEFMRSTYKTNPSERERHTGYYYDRETIELVRQRDALLIAQYDYTPPELD